MNSCLKKLSDQTHYVENLGLKHFACNFNFDLNNMYPLLNIQVHNDDEVKELLKQVQSEVLGPFWASHPFTWLN